MAETYTATLDRIVNGKTAVLLLEADEETVDQLNVDVEQLPTEGQHEGAIFEISVDNEQLRTSEYRPELTQSRKESVQDRLDSLSTKFSDREDSETDN